MQTADRGLTLQNTLTDNNKKQILGNTPSRSESTQSQLGSETQPFATVVLAKEIEYENIPIQKYSKSSTNQNVEAEKIEKIKELLKQGNAAVPHRSSMTNNSPVVNRQGNMNGVTAAKFSSAGFVNYDL